MSLNSEYQAADANLDDDISINPRKIWEIIWSRRVLLVKVFCSVLIFFIALTFILPKKYKVTADLYINKANSSNMMEVNPYILGDASGSMFSMGSDKAMMNELELLKSALVLDKVIRENNLVYKKKYKIFPNKKEGEFLSAKDFYKKGKILKLENIKNTNVIRVEYKDKKPEVAYGIVSSLINNYVDLHKKINLEKAKADKKILEEEYEKTKKSLDEKLAAAKGVPAQSITGIGNLTAMSGFSKSASRAIGNLQSQYITGERSQIAITEEKEKLAQLATKLEWAKMVDNISDTSKVLVINAPQKLRPFENSSPKLLINILLGIVFGFVAALAALIYAEVSDKKLAYSMLTNNIVFDAGKNLNSLKLKIFSYNPQKILLISLTELPKNIAQEIGTLSNAALTNFEMTSEFANKISAYDKAMLISKISDTDTELYKNVKETLKNQNKEVVYDVIL
ncbi:MAG: hypothetical protein K6A44_07665 [bacterium]|nr:hypothetical protein [bacterium]